MTTLYQRKKENLVLNQYLCPFLSVSKTMGGGLEWIRSGWGGGRGDYNRSIKDFLNTGHMMVYLTLQHVPHSFIINGDESVYTSRITIPQSPNTENYNLIPSLTYFLKQFCYKQYTVSPS